MTYDGDLVILQGAAAAFGLSLTSGQLETLGRYRDKAAGIRNFAVYEIPELLDRILSDSTDREVLQSYPGAPKHSSIELFH